jgi:hypothetical protein
MGDSGGACNYFCELVLTNVNYQFTMRIGEM